MAYYVSCGSSASRCARRSIFAIPWQRFPLLPLFARALSGLVASLVLIAPSSAQAPASATAPAPAKTKKELAFELSFGPTVSKQPITARVYVLLTTPDSTQEPRLGPDWFHPKPFYAVDVVDWKPGTPLRIDSRAVGYPGPLKEIAAGDYAIQAVIRLNKDTHKIGDGEGNAYGPIVKAKIDPDEGKTIALKVDTIVPPRVFAETDQIKLVELPSAKLSTFHGRPITHRAAVILPEGVVPGRDGKKLPTVYIIPGFGGDHFLASRMKDSPRFGFGKDFLRVILDPDCGTGHHVFADSATNGPRGAALIEEFIPYIEKTFPAIADPAARLVNGHSSGGWSSLWLQVTYPAFFGGTWSTSPDPVDFRDFQKIDIYATGENMYRDRKGERRPIARIGTKPVLFYDLFSKLDDVIGWGGQLGSFEAVFSPLDQAGKPRKLWNRQTGQIDLEVAKAWEAYDIRLILERKWPSVSPHLKHKIHVITGSMDTFYLEGAVRLLQEALVKYVSDAEIEVIPDRDHSNILDAKLARRIDEEMHKAVADLIH
jgi:Putative esterase